MSARSDAKSIAERNRLARERRANDPEQLSALMGKVDRDKYDVSGYGDKAIAMAFQGDMFGEDDYADIVWCWIQVRLMVSLWLNS